MGKSEDARPSDEPVQSGKETAASVGPAPPLRVVGIGASAGGLGALKKLFAGVSESPGVCFVVVVHLSVEHESHLPDLLQPHTRLLVQQVTEATSLEPNHVYVIPPGVNMDASDRQLQLVDLEEQRQERAPIDHFFRTLAEAHHENAVGVVLTGTGSDGTLGLRRIRERGGLTIVQSPDEAEYDAMPRSAIAAGAADLILPLDQIPAHILELGQTPLNVSVSDEPGPLIEQADRTLQRILAHVRAHTGHDFAAYKRSTILRRIRRRMQLHRVDQLADYLGVLREQDEEVGLLFEDLLITVTEFFRDPAVFEHVESEVIPELFKDKGPNDRVRVWSVGCATGEEAYSLAMLLLEERDRREPKPKQVQVFATDLHEPALRRAREGVYPETVKTDVSPERLDRFFSKEDGFYRIRQYVREQIVFATHNILQDPPFSRIQLISCRNLLIYLQREAQQQLAAMFHYALEEGGYLLVGSAEGIDSELFVCENRAYGLYRRRSVPTPKIKPTSLPLTSAPAAPQAHGDPHEQPAASYGTLHEQAVELYAPPSALIDPDGEVVHYSARAGRFLQFPGGTPTHNIYRLLPEPLGFELRTALHTARDQGTGYRSRPVSLWLEGQQRQIALRVQPIEQPRMEGYSLVIFDELEEAGVASSPTANAPSEASVRELETELEQTKRRMQTLIEEHEAAQERTQAYNEELESTNEELRSTMEELETSQEEMQSMNEELTTLNEENRQKVEELEQLSSDLHNLLTATEIATVFLDRGMRIMRFTPSMAELFNMRDSDRGRSLADLTHRLGYEQLHEDFRRVLEQLTPVEREVAGDNGQWYLVRLQCYRTGEDRIEGAVITFIDITERKRAEEETAEAKHLADEIIDTVRNPMLVVREDLRVERTNAAFREMFRVDDADVRGRLVYELNHGQWDIPELRRLLETILPQNESMDDFEVEHEFRHLGKRTLLLNARRIDHLQLILLALEDVTERRQVQDTLERSRDELERQVKQRTHQLQQQATRLQDLVRELNTAEQRERKRMAAVLHDELQQLLVAMKMHIGLARDRLRDDEATTSLDRAAQQLDEAIELTRTLVRQVVPQALYEQGLIPALQWLSEEMSRRHGLTVRINADDAELSLNDAIKTLLFECAREMLFNVVKHADVHEAAVDLHRTDGGLRLMVSDAGAGFDVTQREAQPGKSGFGVFAMGDRVEALGGSWSIDSKPGEGTQVRLELPLTAIDEDASADQAPEGEGATPPVPRAVDTSEGVIRVLVADDHALVREGIANVLREAPGIVVVGEAGDGEDAISAVEQHQPDMVLMDINMPGMNGIKATREICQRWPGTIVVGLSMENERSETTRAIIDAGAAAFLPKSNDSKGMIETIVKLASPSD